MYSAVAGVDAHVVDARARPPEQKVAGHQLIQRDPDAQRALLGSRARQLATESVGEYPAGEPGAIETRRGRAAVGVRHPELRISLGDDRLPPALESLSLSLGGRLVGHITHVLFYLAGEVLSLRKGTFHLGRIGRQDGRRRCTTPPEEQPRQSSPRPWCAL